MAEYVTTQVLPSHLASSNVRRGHVHPQALSNDHFSSTKPPGCNDTPAMRQALATTELLENILSFLPCRDLLRASHSSWHLRSVIFASPSLKANLFLRQVHNLQDRPLETWDAKSVRVNNLFNVKKTNSGSDRRGGDWMTLSIRHTAFHFDIYFARNGVQARFKQQPQAVEKHHAIPERLAKMYLTDPPIPTHMFVLVPFRQQGADLWKGEGYLRAYTVVQSATLEDMMKMDALLKQTPPKAMMEPGWNGRAEVEQEDVWIPEDWPDISKAPENEHITSKLKSQKVSWSLQLPVQDSWYWIR